MKILLAGDFQYFWYQEACSQALEKLGHVVIRFPWHTYFNSLMGKAELKYVVPGPFTLTLNKHLLQAAIQHQPDILFIWGGKHIRSDTLSKIHKETSAYVVSYNNDDPFSPKYKNSNLLHCRRMWKNFYSTIPAYDHHFVFRPVNIDEMKKFGAKKVAVLMPYYIPEIQKPVILSEEEEKNFKCDAVFVGHYENDGRLSYLKALADAGIHVRLFGGNWTSQVLNGLSDYFREVYPVLNEDYTKALCGAKVCLSFLSKLNRDIFTRRSFEIPACGCVMVSERTPDLLNLFKEDEEAVFFSTPEEMVIKIRELLTNERKRQAIAYAGRHRCIQDGHDIVSRMNEFISCIQLEGFN